VTDFWDKKGFGRGAVKAAVPWSWFWGESSAQRTDGASPHRHAPLRA